MVMQTAQFAPNGFQSKVRYQLTYLVLSQYWQTVVSFDLLQYSPNTGEQLA